MSEPIAKPAYDLARQAAKLTDERRAALGLGTTTGESRLAGIPEDLRFIVDKLLLMHDGGWEVCGFQGGGSGKVQFQKVEWRRVKRDGTE